MSVPELRKSAVLILVASAILAAGCGGSSPPPPAAPPQPQAPRFLWPAEAVADLRLPPPPEKPALDAARVDAFVALERRLRGELASAPAERREAAVRDAGFRDSAEHAEFSGRVKQAFEVLQNLRVLQKMESYGGSTTASYCRGDVRQKVAKLGLSEPDLRLLHDKSADLVGLLGK